MKKQQPPKETFTIFLASLAEPGTHCDKNDHFVFRVNGNIDAQFCIIDKWMGVTCPKCKKKLAVKVACRWELVGAATTIDKLHNFATYIKKHTFKTVADIPDCSLELLQDKITELEKQSKKCLDRAKEIKAFITGAKKGKKP